ncbi:short-chain fatty acyl-CoA regulator family protein [Pelagibius sp. CAU 1746]|uniref:helix-turn-helix domain-containing protein n=1 Tax=Pelagibius sp. CAU 1746 TaxID=3140370 RepID=UPI00325A706D
MPTPLIGLRIRERRKELGLTQTELAARIGISVSYLNLIEHNKRSIGGRLLLQIAEELDVGLEMLDGATERRLVGDLNEALAEPLFDQLRLDPASIGDLVGRHPEWAQALVTLHRAFLDRSQAMHALADRLNQDPFLGDAIHRILTNVSAIRSISEILTSVEDVDAAQQHRFHTILSEESARLSSAAQGLSTFFDKAHTATRSTTPTEEVDDFILENRAHFPVLEDAAKRLRRRLGAHPRVMEERMLEVLAEDHGLHISHASPDNESHYASRAPLRYSPHNKRVLLLDSAPAAGRRFALARLLARLDFAGEIGGIISASATMTTPAARERAAAALQSYCAGAALMPYDSFLEDAVKARYDIDLLRRAYGTSVEQVCHRLVTLRRPGSEGIPFAFLRSDPAGYVTKRFPLPNLPLPRYGGACPLWAVYRAFQMPETVVSQLAEFPSGDRFLFVSRAVTKGDAAYGQPRHLLSIMLACEALYADQTVYGDRLDLSAAAPADRVGATCRLCARGDCPQRQEDVIIKSPPPGLGGAGPAAA